MITEQMEKIKEGILAKYPSAIITVEVFPSGAAILDARLGTRLFACSFTPSQGFGIDEVKDEGGLTSTYSHAATDEEGAIKVLLHLIEDQD
jgi:hypothetical protein